MSRTTLIGYNRNHCTTDPIQLDTFGTGLVSAAGEYLIIPAGWGIREIYVKNVGPDLVGTNGATKLILYLGEVGVVDINVMEMTPADLNGTPSVSMIGTDASPITSVMSVDKYMMIKTDTGTFGLDSIVCVSVKIKRL